MNSGSIKKDILGSFPSASKKDWIDAATKELDDTNPIEKLKKTNSGLSIDPYYDSSDDVNTPFQLSASTNIYKSPRAWENLSIVHISNSAIANKAALLALQSGADGILFSLEQNSFSETLLKNIQWEHCSLRFSAVHGQERFFSELASYASNQNLNQKKLLGSVFWKSLPTDAVALMNSFKEFEEFQCFGICLQAGESKQIAIANALAQGAHLINIATHHNIPIAQAIRQIAFSVPIGTDFFLEIATLKTLRRLWYQIMNAYDSSLPSLVHIHAQSTVFTKSQFQDHANLIKSSTAALASILGGCDSLSIEPENSNDTMLPRIARNVSSILLEESHLGLVADPTAGSYYIENLTNQLSNSSWKLFQEQVAL